MEPLHGIHKPCREVTLITPAERTRLVAQAQREQRSKSSMIRLALLDYLDRQEKKEKPDAH